MWDLDSHLEVDQHIRKKTHKPNALRFWVEGGVIPLYVWPCSHSCEISPILPLGLPNKWYQSRRFVAVTRLIRVQFDPVSKVFLTKVSRKRVPFKCVNGAVQVRVVCDYGIRIWKMLPLEGECTNVEGTLTWGGDLLGIQVWV